MIPETTTTNQVLTAEEITDTRAAALYVISSALNSKSITWQQFIDTLNTVIDPTLDAQGIFFHSAAAIVATVKLATSGSV